MPIQPSDIQYRLSGGAVNTAPALSLGGAKAAAVAGTNIFDDVSSVEAAAGHIEYRCVYVHNAHATLTLVGAVAWLNSNTPSAATDIALGLGTSVLNATETATASETAAPAGVTFSAAAGLGAGVVLGDIPPGQSRAIWLRRTVGAGAAAIGSDPFTVRVEGDTAP
jgi:hypothetical protein